jgi:hypothetical protein
MKCMIFIKGFLETCLPQKFYSYSLAEKETFAFVLRHEHNIHLLFKLYENLVGVLPLG